MECEIALSIEGVKMHFSENQFLLEVRTPECTVHYTGEPGEEEFADPVKRAKGFAALTDFDVPSVIPADEKRELVAKTAAVCREDCEFAIRKVMSILQKQLRVLEEA